VRSILRLIRLPNLAIIALTLYAFRYFVIRPYYGMSGTGFQLNSLEYGLVVGITMLIAATGYIINDYYDIDIDSINKPEHNLFSERHSLRSLLFIAILSTFLTAVFIIFLSVRLNSGYPAIILFVALATVWWYAKALKRSFILGNLAVALMSALTLGMLWFFEWLKLKQSGISIYEIRPITQFAAGISSFAFLLSLIREIVKDMEDMEGDSRYGCRSLPLVKGIEFSKTVVAGLSVILIVTLVYCQVWLSKQSFDMLVAWLLIVVELPLIVFLYRLKKSGSPLAFHNLSTLLKWIMVGGISSMAILGLNFIL